MRRADYFLAVLSAGGKSKIFSPVQLQFLFFMIDRDIPHLIGGARFQFTEMAHGPFDDELYDEIDALAYHGLLSITRNGISHANYRLTPEGWKRGSTALALLIGNAADVVREKVDIVDRHHSIRLLQLAQSSYGFGHATNAA
jgi:hypothetical protein